MAWPQTPETIRALFVRGVAATYLIAFVSFWRQAHGLIGEQGILPAGEFLERVAGLVGLAEGIRLLPGWLWLGAGDVALHLLCAVGVVSSLVVLSGAVPLAGLAIAWSCYLSIVTAGQVFLSYQWDILLLETGIVALLWAPTDWRPRLRWPGEPSIVVVWLSRWLLFRLMWSSGVVKLLSGDPTWRNLTAMGYHYETQPIPTWTSHFAHHLPDWLHSIEVLLTFGIELLLPLAIFGPLRWRRCAAVGFVGLNLLISATGNYGFFNLLTIVLCIPLLEHRQGGTVGQLRSMGGALRPLLASAIMLLGAANLSSTLGLPGLGWLQPIQRLLAPLHVSGSYGLFARMTTQRPEIVVEGSQDGRRWYSYEFAWKPTSLTRRPRFAPLHMPRLDWQMWFAALQGADRAPWFGRFAGRLLTASPPVLELLAVDPFDGKPPAYLRAQSYDYRFSSPASRQIDVWWKRENPRPYTPVLTLQKRQP